MKNKRIAIDSGIILDSNRIKQQWLLKNLDLKFELWQVNKTELEPIIGQEIYERMRQEIFTRESILAHPVVKGIEKFFKEFRGNKIYMLTVKTPDFIPYLAEWLYQKSFSPQILTAYNTTKAEICREYGVNIIIDDDIRHLKEIPPQIERIFFKPEQPPESLDSIVQFGSWNEITNYLKK